MLRELLRDVWRTKCLNVQGSTQAQWLTIRYSIYQRFVLFIFPRLENCKVIKGLQNLSERPKPKTRPAKKKVYLPQLT